MADAPSWIISINVMIDPANHRSMVFQTHVPQDTPREEMNKIIDTAFAVSDRQVDAYNLVKLENDKRDSERELFRAKELFLIAEQNMERKHELKANGELTLDTREAAERNNMLSSIKAKEDAVAWAEQRITVVRQRMEQDRY